MENLPNDVLIYMALSMDLPEILSLCRVNSNINNIICDNEVFWMNKLRHDYNIHGHKDNYKTRYKYITDQLKDPNTALQFGSVTNDVDLVRLAIERGAELYMIHPISNSITNDSFNVFKYLIDNNYYINKNYLSYNLTFASQYNRIKYIEYLLDNGANIHYYNDFLLRNAVTMKHLDQVKFLLSRGANINALTEYDMNVTTQKIKDLIENN